MSQNPSAKVVVLSPSVSLVKQQCMAFAATPDFRAAAVEASEAKPGGVGWGGVGCSLLMLFNSWCTPPGVCTGLGCCFCTDDCTPCHAMLSPHSAKAKTVSNSGPVLTHAPPQAPTW